MKSSKRSSLLLRVALLSAACALSSARARADEKPPVSSMLAGAVTYTLPAGWHVSMYINTSRDGSADIINTEHVMDTPQARLFLSAHFLREKKTVSDVRDEAFGSVLRKKSGGAVLSDKSDGEDWRTVVWRQDDRGGARLMLEHFGVVNGKFVDLTVDLPLGSGGVRWMKQVVADFNAACESLKVDGRGSFERKVSPDIVTKQLKAGAKK